ncbi:unnamed protein product [Hymenolepis diminuta]|uniref:Uncharacterized protein n=1 Tax=Hymenolepis diminuta TaxID=6216 RepID=A0A564Y8Q6_HYMDI|nr:unnamed protein product [Hymenolepis diminuta]
MAGDISAAKVLFDKQMPAQAKNMAREELDQRIPLGNPVARAMSLGGYKQSFQSPYNRTFIELSDSKKSHKERFDKVMDEAIDQDAKKVFGLTGTSW